MQTRLPEAAAVGPPLTPQSTMGTPRCAASAPIAATHSVVIVLTTTTVVLGAQAASTFPGAQQHGADLLVVDYSHHDDVGLASELRRGTGHCGIAGVAEVRFGAHVIDNQRQRSRMDIGSDAATYSAESDYPDHRTILSMLFCEQESPSLIERRSAMAM